MMTFFAEVLREVRDEAEKYGCVTEVKASGNGHAFVEFPEASDCASACAGLTGATFDGKTVVAVFYPPTLWNSTKLAKAPTPPPTTSGGGATAAADHAKIKTNP